MHAWIPVVSSSLYFWKSVFSSRADSILNSDGDFNMSNWKFPDRVHFFGAWTRQAVIETIVVVYQLTKRTQEKLFAYWAKKYKAFFVPNQEPASAWIFGNSSVRVGTQGLFRPYLKTFLAPFLPTRLTAPGSPRMFRIWLLFFAYGDREGWVPRSPPPPPRYNFKTAQEKASKITKRNLLIICNIWRMHLQRYFQSRISPGFCFKIPRFK